MSDKIITPKERALAVLKLQVARSSQSEVARLLGFHRQQISATLRNKRTISAGMALKVLETFGGLSR